MYLSAVWQCLHELYSGVCLRAFKCPKRPSWLCRPLRLVRPTRLLALLLALVTQLLRDRLLTSIDKALL